MHELIPTGKLRAGLVFAPAPSALFVVKDKNGIPRGVTVDLSRDLARQLGVEVEFMLAPNTGELTDALASGAIDVSFMPVDDERRQRVDFGPVYFLVESTYLATEASGIKTAEEVDRPGVRVVGIANTTTIRAAARSLKHTTITAMQSVGEAVAMLASGKAEAFALSRDSLPPFAKMLPGSRIVTGGFQLTGIAIAVPKGRPAALAYVSKFLDKAKHFGMVRRAFDAAGFPNEPVAP
jgi:polar amino acid transport system substrate-binding protein